MFINKQIGSFNKDADISLEKYLEITRDFKSSFKDFTVIKLDDFNIIDESMSCPVGFKARASEFLIQNIKLQNYKEIVYVQPRKGFAGISLAYMCKKYGLDLTLIMPSSKLVSEHQLYCIEQGAKPLFVRVAAMKNANIIARKYAESVGAYYIPLGLYHKDVIACGVKCVYDYFEPIEKPKTMWSVISTGVLQRILQIALPTTSFVAVAVSRNIQHGELGTAKFMSYHKPFNSVSDYIPSFNCENSYDAKGYDYMKRYGNKGDWFFSVAGNAPKASSISPESIHSYRHWNDLRDFNNHIK